MKQPKPKLCKQCGKEFKPFNSLQVVCNAICALKFNSEKEVKKRVKEMKVTSQKLSDLESVARKVFQQWIRKRDENKPCISCGTLKTLQWDAGHFHSAEQFSGLIFDEMNVNGQCVYCNRNLYGNLLEYRKGMIKKYGELAVEGLEELANESRTFKYTRDMYQQIITSYKQKLKE